MWPFLSRSKSGEPPDRPKLKFEKLRIGLNIEMFKFENREALKFWLPEPVAEALDEMSRLQGTTMSAMLREFFLAHVYGIYVVTCLKQRHPNCFDDNDPMFSIKSSGYVKKRDPTYWVPELGKNVAPIKVWIPKELKTNLQILADHSKIKLSQYVREITISRLLGHGSLPMRSNMLTAVTLPEADRWAEGEEVPMRQINRGEHKFFANMEPDRHDNEGDDKQG